MSCHHLPFEVVPFRDFSDSLSFPRHSIQLDVKPGCWIPLRYQRKHLRLAGRATPKMMKAKSGGFWVYREVGRCHQVMFFFFH